MPREGQRLPLAASVEGPTPSVGLRARSDDIPGLPGPGAKLAAPSLDGEEIELTEKPAAPLGSGAVQGQAAVAKQIVARAATVRRQGEYIGFFEFAIWCFLRRRNLCLNLGTKWVHLDELHPMLQEYTRAQDSKTSAHIAGCHWDDELSTWAAIHEEYKFALGHYVAAVPLDDKPPTQEVCRTLQYQLYALGYMIIGTAAQGDCGIDALAYYDNDFVDLGLVEYRKLRYELATAMRTFANEVSWQKVFRACQENGDEAPPDLVEEVSSGDEACYSSDDDTSDSGSSHDSDQGFWQQFEADVLADALTTETVTSTRAETSGSARGCKEPSGSTATVPPAETSGSARGCRETSGSTATVAPVAMSTGTVDMSTATSTHAPARGRPQFKLFRQYLAELSVEELRKIAGSLGAYRACESRFYADHPPPQRARAKLATRTSCALHQTLALGRSYQKWLLLPEGQAAQRNRRQLRAFLVRGTNKREIDIRKSETQRLTRAWHLVLEQDLHDGMLTTAERAEEAALAQKIVERSAKKRNALGEAKERNSLPPLAHTVDQTLTRAPRLGHVDQRRRRRRLRLQGGPCKCEPLREALFDWFVDMRSLFAKISPQTVLSHADMIAKEVFKEARQRGEWPELPKLGSRWLRGWRREYRISLRKPNTKYKLSKEKLIRRLTCMWTANLRVRWLAWLCLGRELEAWGADQKPLYMNEGGHKGQQTLHLAGTELAISTDIIAQTRQRVSAMTVVTSSLAEASSSLPLALCFKGKTERVLQRLPTNLGPNFIFQFAPKGSYRTEHVVEFLRRALPTWTPERAASKDWRLLYLDAYKPHFAQEVVEEAWAHGFVVLWHGAGTTGLTQVNDTHLHAPFERIYCDMENESMAYQKKWDPAHSKREREDVVFDAVATWRAVGHKEGALGHKRNGLTNSLSGREDPLLGPDVRELWDACDVGRLRTEIKQEIQAKVEAGTLRWDWESIQEIAGSDSLERALGSYAQPGAELEAAQQEGEQVWKDADDRETEEEREERKQEIHARKLSKASAGGLPAHSINGVAVPAAVMDSEADKTAADIFAKKQQQLDDILKHCKGQDMAPFRWTVETKKRRLIKAHYASQSSKQEGIDLIRRYLQVQADAEREGVEKHREERRAVRQKLALQAAMKKKLKNQLGAQKIEREKKKIQREAEEAAAKAAQALRVREFQMDELKSQNAKDKASRQARSDYLQRWRLVCGLNSNVADFWEEFREWYVDWIVKREPKTHHTTMWAMGKKMKEKTRSSCRCLFISVSGWKSSGLAE